MKYYSPLDVSKSIKDYFKENPIKIKDFCSNVGISRPTYYNLIRGKNNYVQPIIIKKLIKYWVLK